MSLIPQTPFDSARFADNPEPRCPCILLLDTSGSMSGEPFVSSMKAYRRFAKNCCKMSLQRGGWKWRW